MLHTFPSHDDAKCQSKVFWLVAGVMDSTEYCVLNSLYKVIAASRSYRSGVDTFCLSTAQLSINFLTVYPVAQTGGSSDDFEWPTSHSLLSRLADAISPRLCGKGPFCSPNPAPSTLDAQNLPVSSTLFSIQTFHSSIAASPGSIASFV